MPGGFAGQVNEVLVNKEAGSLGDRPSINNLAHPRSVVVPEDVDGGREVERSPVLVDPSCSSRRVGDCEDESCFLGQRGDLSTGRESSNRDFTRSECGQNVCEEEESSRKSVRG